MASLTFILTDADKRSFTPDRVISYELSRDVSAPSDSLRLTLLCDEGLEETVSAKAYLDGKLIFSGPCDMQREEIAGEGVKAFLFFRSEAAVLVDSEAQPYTYESPSARSMFIINAEPFGFKFDMKDCVCSGKYAVYKGCSCYSAINTLVSETYGKNVIVTPDMRLTLPDGKQVYNIGENEIISERRIFNRGEVLFRIDCKTASEASYNRHFKSRLAERKGIKRLKKVNLSSLCDWQRDYELRNILNSSVKKYCSIELTLDGAHNPELYGKAGYKSSFDEDIDKYSVDSVCIVFDGRGERTYVKLVKNIDPEEIMYVD